MEFDQTTIVSLSDLVHSVVNHEKWWFVQIPERYGCYSGVMEMQAENKQTAFSMINIEDFFG